MTDLLSRYRPVYAPAAEAGSEGAAAPAAGESPATGGGAADTSPVADTPSPADKPSPVDRTNDFMQMGFDEGDDDEVVVVPKAPPAPEKAAVLVAEAPKPVTTQEAAKPPVKPPAPVAEAAAPAPKAEDTAAPRQPSAKPTDTPLGLAEQLATHREAMLDSLAAERFKLTDKEAQDITADPAGAIPRLMSRVFFEATNTMLLHMQNFVPKLAMQLIKDMKANDEVMERFYGSNKALDRAKHNDDVMQYARVFRETNPKVSQEDLFALVASAVMAKYGLSALPAVAPAPVARPPNGAGAPQPTPAPYVPARPGTGGVRVTAQPDDNPFMGLGRDYDED